MYSDIVTIFNRYTSGLGDMWLPSVFNNCNLAKDRAFMVSTYGENTTNNAILNVRFIKAADGKRWIDRKEWLQPKQWDDVPVDELRDYVRAQGGDDFDFFVEGDFSDMGAVFDDDYIDGFYDYMRSKYDNVYAVTSVAEFKAIPHIEIAGR